MCCIAGLASPATGRPLDGLIRFEDPYRCHPGEGFHALLKGAIA
jgi:hypothetical protein